MFIMMLTYKKPIEIVEQYQVEHREFLEKGYQKDYFIVSGPRNPRTGGIIFSQLKDREQLMEIMKLDPFLIHGVADYEYIEFNPVKYHHEFSPFI